MCDEPKNDVPTEEPPPDDQFVTEDSLYGVSDDDFEDDDEVAGVATSEGAEPTQPKKETLYTIEGRSGLWRKKDMPPAPVPIQGLDMDASINAACDDFLVKRLLETREDQAAREEQLSEFKRHLSGGPRRGVQDGNFGGLKGAFKSNKKGIF